MRKQKKIQFLMTAEQWLGVVLLTLLVVGVLIATAANIVHAFGDCIFRSPAVLSQFLILLAAVEAFLHDDRGEK